MRIALVMLFLLGASVSVHAGIYMPGEEGPIVVKDGKGQALPFDAFRVVLQDYMQIAIPQFNSKQRQEYLQIRTEIAAKGERASVDELIRAGAALMRLRDLEQALAVLQTARARDPRNFVVQSQLALVLHQLGHRDAAGYQVDALSLRPRELPGLNREQTEWYLRIERFFYELLKARLREQRDRAPRTPIETLDPIFPVNFVGESGAYEAGALAAAEKAKLPEDAIAVVQQLLLWMPDDPRLYWLLAELYNAHGDLKAAATIFDECVDARRFHTEQLRAHRLIVKDAIALQQEEAAKKPATWRDHPEILWSAGGVVALLLLPLLYWQVRELRKKLGGNCATGH